MVRNVNKETYSYYKNAYRANLRYRKKKGNLDNINTMLTEKEWNLAHRFESNKDLVWNDFHYYDRQTADTIIAKTFELTGKKLNATQKFEVSMGKTSAAYKQAISDYNKKMQDDGITDSFVRAKTISQLFFGSE